MAVVSPLPRPTWEDGLRACPLAAGPFPPEARRCDWCGGELAGRRRRWCSDDCSNAFTRNHAWTSARAAALARDGHRCTRCGSAGPLVAETVYAWIQMCCPRPWFGYREWCADNGWYPDHLEARDAFRAHVHRVMAPWTAARTLYLRGRRAGQLEVNHRTPCLGQHSASSCAHHVEGLETLCHRCHVAETARQRRAGLLSA